MTRGGHIKQHRYDSGNSFDGTSMKQIYQINDRSITAGSTPVLWLFQFIFHHHRISVYRHRKLYFRWYWFPYRSPAERRIVFSFAGIVAAQDVVEILAVLAEPDLFFMDIDLFHIVDKVPARAGSYRYSLITCFTSSWLISSRIRTSLLGSKQGWLLPVRECWQYALGQVFSRSLLPSYGRWVLFNAVSRNRHELAEFGISEHFHRWSDHFRQP